MFHFESSLNFHMKRRSMLIAHHCTHCGCRVVSYNRCQFLAHLQQHSDTAGISVESLDIKVIPSEQELMAVDSLPMADSDPPNIDQITSTEAHRTGCQKVSSSVQAVDRDLSEVSRGKIETQETNISQMLSLTEADPPMENNTTAVPTEAIVNMGSLEMNISGASDVDPISSSEERVEAAGEKEALSKESSGREPSEKIHNEINMQVMKNSQNYSIKLEDLPTQKEISVVQLESVASQGSVPVGISESSNVEPLISSEDVTNEGDKECSSKKPYGTDSSEVSHDKINMQEVTIRQSYHHTLEDLSTQNNTSAGSPESEEDSPDQNVDSLLPSNKTNCLEDVIDTQGEKESSSGDYRGRDVLKGSHDNTNLPVMNIPQTNDPITKQISVEKDTPEVLPKPVLQNDYVAIKYSDSCNVALHPTDQVNHLDKAVDGGVEKISSSKESGGREPSQMINDKRNMQVMKISENYGQMGKRLTTQNNTPVLSDSVIAYGSPASNAAKNLEGSVNAGGEKKSSCNELDSRVLPNVNRDEIVTQVKNIGQKNCPAMEHLPTQSNTATAGSWACCPECKAELTTDIRNHFQRGLRNLKKQYCCPECRRFLPNPCSLLAHRRYHHRQRPFVCPECGCCFGLWSSFVVHLQLKCSHLDRFVCSKCPKCGSLFADDTSLQKHILRQHVKLAFKCESCSTLCYQMASVEQHKIRRHGRRDMRTTQLRQCQLCNVCVKNPTQIFGHIVAHIKKIHYVYAFKCTNCNILFEKRACFSAHRNKNHSLVSNTKVLRSDESVINNNIMPALPSSGRSLLINKAKDGSCVKKNNDVNNHSFFETNSSESTSINNEGILKNLSEDAQCKRPISHKIMQQNATTSLDKDSRPDVSKTALPGPTGNTKNSSVTDNVVKKVIRSSVVDKGSLSLEMANGRFMKVSKVVRKCVSCNNDITFSGPSLQPLESLPTNCVNCLKEPMSTPIDTSTCRDRKKTVVCIKKIEMSNTNSVALDVDSAVSHEFDQNTKNEGNLVNGHQTTSTAKNDSTTDFIFNTSRERKDSSTENASKEIVENTNVEETFENTDPAPKRKRVKLNKKHGTPTTTSFASGRLIYPITENSGVYNCFKCEISHSSKSEFETHVLTHKTDSSSFQCMECGMCFSVQPSFGKHLLASHNIADTEKYISDNPKCKDDSHDRYSGGMSSDEDADEYRCSVCHVVCESSAELNNHFRSHGMAFLLKKQNKFGKNMTQ